VVVGSTACSCQVIVSTTPSSSPCDVAMQMRSPTRGGLTSSKSRAGPSGPSIQTLTRMSALALVGSSRLSVSGVGDQRNALFFVAAGEDHHPPAGLAEHQVEATVTNG